MSGNLVPTDRSLTSFKLLSFDVYGTLIDWEGGIYSTYLANKPFSNLPEGHELRNRKKLLVESEKRERAQQKITPGAEYADILSDTFKQLAKNYNLGSEQEIEEGAKNFGEAVGDWPVFPDTLEALERLKKHYYLVPLTNSSPKTFGASQKGPFKGFEFSAAYLAYNIGSYKPDLRNFEYLFKNVKESFGVDKRDILHVAQSLYHDHEPAKKVGLTSCWINRQGAMGESEDAEFAWEFATLGELADAVDKELAGKK